VDDEAALRLYRKLGFRELHADLTRAPHPGPEASSSQEGLSNIGWKAYKRCSDPNSGDQMPEKEFREAVAEFIGSLISLSEGYLRLLKAALAWGRPGFWASMASEDTRVVGAMFKALAIFTTSISSMPKVSTPEDLEVAEKAIGSCISKLRELLDELEGE